MKILTPGRFSIVKRRVKNMVLTYSLSSWAEIYSRALKTKKSQSPSCPVGVWGGGGSVVTNYWLVHK